MGGGMQVEQACGHERSAFVHPHSVRSRLGAEPLIRNALFRVKKGRTIHTLEFSTIS